MTSVYLSLIHILSGGTKIAFLMMRAVIERDGIAWEEVCAQRSECGKKGGRPKKYDESGNTDEKAEILCERF